RAPRLALLPLQEGVSGAKPNGLVLRMQLVSKNLFWRFRPARVDRAAIMWIVRGNCAVYVAHRWLRAIGHPPSARRAIGADTRASNGIATATTHRPAPNAGQGSFAGAPEGVRRSKCRPARPYVG